MDALTSQRIWSVIAMAPTELTKLALSIAHEGTLPIARRSSGHGGCGGRGRLDCGGPL